MIQELENNDSSDGTHRKKLIQWEKKPTSTTIKFVKSVWFVALTHQRQLSFCWKQLTLFAGRTTMMSFCRTLVERATNIKCAPMQNCWLKPNPNQALHYQKAIFTSTSSVPSNLKKLRKWSTDSDLQNCFLFNDLPTPLWNALGLFFQLMKTKYTGMLERIIKVPYTVK